MFWERAAVAVMRTNGSILSRMLEKSPHHVLKELGYDMYITQRCLENEYEGIRRIRWMRRRGDDTFISLRYRKVKPIRESEEVYKDCKH